MVGNDDSRAVFLNQHVSNIECHSLQRKPQVSYCWSRTGTVSYKSVMLLDKEMSRMYSELFYKLFTVFLR